MVQIEKKVQQERGKHDAEGRHWVRRVSIKISCPISTSPISIVYALIDLSSPRTSKDSLTPEDRSRCNKLQREIIRWSIFGTANLVVLSKSEITFGKWTNRKIRIKTLRINWNEYVNANTNILKRIKFQHVKSSRRLWNSLNRRSTFLVSNIYIILRNYNKMRWYKCFKCNSV